MSNALGVAANALDGDIAQLQSDLAVYLAAGGHAKDFLAILHQKLMQTSGHANLMTNAVLKAPRPRPSPAVTANATVASITPGSVYP